MATLNINQVITGVYFGNIDTSEYFVKGILHTIDSGKMPIPDGLQSANGTMNVLNIEPNKAPFIIIQAPLVAHQVQAFEDLMENVMNVSDICKIITTNQYGSSSCLYTFSNPYVTFLSSGINTSSPTDIKITYEGKYILTQS